MSVDSARLQELLSEAKGFQLGFAARVTASRSAKAVEIVGSQVLRVGGEQWDLQAWRFYLGPWKPDPSIAVPDAVTTGIIPSLAPNPDLASIEFNAPAALSFYPQLMVYARVKWGSGGARHVAFVDWPAKGLLWQASASYVEVDAIATLFDPDFDSLEDSRLPTLQATISDEPGGGDASAAGTFTYPFQGPGIPWDDAALIDPTTGRPGLNFVVPPFARSVRFFWDNTRADDDSNYATDAIIRLRRNATTALEDGVYVYGFAAGDIGDPREGLGVPALCAYVRVEFEWGGGVVPADRLAGVGVQFELDL